MILIGDLSNALNQEVQMKKINYGWYNSIHLGQLKKCGTSQATLTLLLVSLEIPQKSI